MSLAIHNICDLWWLICEGLEYVVKNGEDFYKLEENPGNGRRVITILVTNCVFCLLNECLKAQRQI